MKTESFRTRVGASKSINKHTGSQITQKQTDTLIPTQNSTSSSVALEVALKVVLNVMLSVQPNDVNQKLNIQRATGTRRYPISLKQVFLQIKQRGQSYNVESEGVSAGTREGEALFFLHVGEVIEMNLLVDNNRRHLDSRKGDTQCPTHSKDEEQ